MSDQIDEPQDDTDTDPYSAFERELTGLINSHSIENQSDTPDFMLARHMVASLRAFNETTQDRTRWYCTPAETSK